MGRSRACAGRHTDVHPHQRTARCSPGILTRTPKYVVFYESADDVRSKAPAHFPAHRARWKEFADRVTLLMIGAFANPQEEGSMAIFTTREAAEEFVKGDPFVLNGVIRRWYIRDWNEALAPDRKFAIFSMC